MQYRFIFSTEPKRVISGVVLDSRFIIPALAGLSGFAVKRYIDNLIVQTEGDVLTYKIETFLGNCAGYFTLQIGNMGQSAVEDQRVLRPSFLADSATISNLISNFISAGGWRPDFLV